MSRVKNWRDLVLATKYHLYMTHKGNSEKRGIGFHFSFTDWITWWEENLGEDWQEKRGPCRGKYVMARYGDKGDYSPNNVECILHSQNLSDKKKNGTIPKGEDAGMAKLTNKQVLKIYKSNLSYKDLSALYNICFWTIFAIRKGHTWIHVTGGIPTPSTVGSNQWKRKT